MNNNKQKETEYHLDIIKCPSCDYLQIGKVEHTIPFASYVHECNNCHYIIMESEWDRVIKLEPSLTISKEAAEKGYKMNTKSLLLKGI